MKNIQYINAGAGSGKTTKLTQILSEELGKPNGKINPSEVILTTFTELAASEFREKSRQQLFKDGRPDIAAELDSATIGTVHSVALSFIQKYWYLIGVSPDMKVMSEDDLQAYISESLGDYVSSDNLVFFRSYGSYFDLKDNQNRVDLNFWKGYLLSIIDRINNYTVDIERSRVESQRVLSQIYSSQTILDYELLERFRSVLSQQIVDMAATNKNNFQPILDSLNSQKVEYTTIVKMYKELSGAPAKIVNAFKDQMGVSDYDALMENLCGFQMSSAGDDSPGYMMCKIIDVLFDIAKEWKDGFNDFKAKRHIIDYNDMERLFLELLEKPQVKKEIEGTYKLMMVDEFQDSSPIQLEIFKHLSDMMKQSYWVGDPKQSIYGFRGADVELVNDITMQFYDETRDPSLRLTHDKLPNSWRTREPLVNLANDCFARAFDGVINKDNVKLNAARKESDSFSAPLYHWNCMASKKEFSAKKVADRVKLLIDSQIVIQDKNNGEFRSITPRDIAILCRKNDECKTFAKALMEKGIPVTFVNNDIMQQTEVHLVLALLSFMVDASNKHVRADLLRLLNDMSTQEVLQQRLNYLIGLNAESPEDVKEALSDQWLEEDNSMIQHLKLFRQVVRNMSVSDLVDSVVYGLSLPEIVAKWGDVENRRQNLHTLCAMAKKYDEHCLQMGIGSSVGGLLTYLSYAELDSTIDNAADAVKVLTYHKSKGLEWYYVILSSLDYDSLNEKEFTKKSFWGVRELHHPESDSENAYIIQFLPPVVGPGKSPIPQPIIDACKNLEIYKTLQEKERNELRHLLYVGVTRARDYLTTLSQQSSEKTLPILHWIKNTGISEGEVKDNALNLWRYDVLPPVYEDISDCPVASKSTSTTYTQYDYPELVISKREPKFLFPSKLPKIELASDKIKILEDLDCRIEPYRTKEENQAAAGTCIHNIFAVYDPTLSHEENVEKATSIRNGNNMYEVIPDVDKVIVSIERLYAWLEQTYGKASVIKHEVPFIHPLPGQVVNGEIDLLWCLNDHKCVLIDFKNFPGSIPNITNPDPKNDHYAGNYASQLKAYHDVLVGSGLTVKDTLIYYSVMGCVVRLEVN